MLLADGLEVKPLMYIQDGRTLLKVSTVYDTHITAQVCIDGTKIPSRTSVRTVLARQVSGMRGASDAIVDRYHAMLDA